MTTPKDVEHGVEYQCNSCGKVYTGDQLNDIIDLSQRVGIEDDMPAGECPSCHALCYPKEESTT